jgi:hypothetical protein
MYDWEVAQYFNLCDTENEREKLVDLKSFSYRKVQTNWFVPTPLFAMA